MTISARSVKNQAETASKRVVDLRHGGRAAGGSYLYQGERLVTDWHAHDLHEIQYAEWGVIEVETASGHHLLPPQQAAWIPAGLDHQTTINTAVRNVAVLLDPALIPCHGERVRIVAVHALLREMMLYALRWPIARPEPDPVSDAFFRTLAHVVTESLEHEMPLHLPSSSHPVVAAAINYTQAHLEAVTSSEVARAVGVSERTLRRQFHSILGMSWRDYLLQARLLRAMARLAGPGLTILDVSVEVGFHDVGSFARSFVRHCGETPSAYRRRVNARST